MEIIIASIVIGFLFCYLLRHPITSTWWIIKVGVYFIIGLCVLVLLWGTIMYLMMSS